MTTFTRTTTVRAAPEDLRRVLAELVDVAIWTSPDGHPQEHASFVLRARDGSRHLVGFADPAAGMLVDHLHSLPGFDRDRLLALIMGPRTGPSRVLPLWSSPADPTPSMVVPAQRGASVGPPAATGPAAATLPAPAATLPAPTATLPASAAEPGQRASV